MTTIALPQISIQTETPVAVAVREGLAASPKRLPAWLFYDEAGSRLFDQITALPEYYLTRTERGILTAHAADMIARAAHADPAIRLRIAELGAGSADKTRLLLKAASERQGVVLYEPVDVSASALHAARERIEGEIPTVHVLPRVMDYTQGLDLILQRTASGGCCSTSAQASATLNPQRPRSYSRLCAPACTAATHCCSVLTCARMKKLCWPRMTMQPV